MFVTKFVDRFVNKFVDRFVNQFLLFSWTSQFLTLGTCQPFPNFSGTRWNVGLDQGFHENAHQLFRKKRDKANTFQKSKQHAEVQCDRRIVDPTLTEMTCTQKYFDGSASVFEVAPDCACTNQSALSRRYPRLHAEISGSMGHTHSTMTNESPKDNCF